LTLPANEPATADVVLAGYFSGVKKGKTDWQQSAPERGRIGGIPFTRVQWTATDPAQGAKVRGVVYCGAKGREVFVLTGMETVGTESSLPLAEAAARTFSKP
jgi:hypothetical protein